MEQERLSQEEIEEMIKQAKAAGPPEGPEEPLGEEQKNSLIDLEEVFAFKASALVSEFTGRKIKVDSPSLESLDLEKLKGDFPLPWVRAEVTFATPPGGQLSLLLSRELGGRLTHWIEGGQGDPSALEEEHLSSLREVIDRVMAVAAEGWSSLLGRSIGFAPSQLSLMDSEDVGWDSSTHLLVNFPIEVDGDPSERIIQVLPWELVQRLVGDQQPTPEERSPDRAESTLGQEDTHAGKPDEKETSPDRLEATLDQADTPGKKPDEEVVVAQPAQFKPLTTSSSQDQTDQLDTSRLDLILDLTLPITVELGRTKMLIKNILELGTGSIIELDKLAGEPVDLLINDRKFAEGEVVVIDENFGVRITNLISLMDRIKNLNRL